jgi:hypothetical protein
MEGILGAEPFRADHRSLSKLAGSFRAFLAAAVTFAVDWASAAG